MSLAVITPDGEFSHDPAPVTGDTIRAHMPSGWFDLVRLGHHRDMYSFVDSDGHPLSLPRNPVGSCVLTLLGAAAYPYCGPVVITGWSEPDPASELRDLTELQLAWLAAIHTGLCQVLAGEGPAWLRVDQSQLRDYAAWVRTSPAPGIRVINPRKPTVDGAR